MARQRVLLSFISFNFKFLVSLFCFPYEAYTVILLDFTIPPVFISTTFVEKVFKFTSLHDCFS